MFPLHSEIEALLWAMDCIRNLREFRVTFTTDCFQLVKMVSESEEWPVFRNYLEDIRTLQGSFISSEIIHVRRMKNLRTDNLVHSARKQSSFVIYMDVELSFWFSESVWICKSWCQKRKKRCVVSLSNLSHI